VSSPAPIIAAARLVAICLAAAPLGALAGCREDRSGEPPRQFFPGLDDQPKYKTQTEHAFFPDGRSARPPASGSVPFGRDYQPAAARDAFLREDDALYRGTAPDGSWLERIPVESVLRDGESFRDLVELGRETFDIYCLPCHGGLAIGGLSAPYAGMVGARWSTPIPNLHGEQYQPGGERGQDGYLFHVIRNGVANEPGQQPPLRMPSYAEVVNEREAWAVVAYLRALQRSRSASFESLPEDARRRLNEQRIQPSGGAGAQRDGEDADQEVAS